MVCKNCSKKARKIIAEYGEGKVHFNIHLKSPEKIR
jgi:hypothetical protein